MMSKAINIKIFADGADKAGMLDMYPLSFIKGFTTNPSLMRKAGIRDYKSFALDIIKNIPDRPISFEVISDDFDEMFYQAMEIASWGDNVYVKIPVTNSLGIPSYDLIRVLAKHPINLNVTAVMTLDQVHEVSNALVRAPSSYISVLAGRIADTGRDPLPIMRSALELMRPYPQQELVWASPREVFNIMQAAAIGCHIITATNDILKKLSLLDKDLRDYSLETVRMFREDALLSGLDLKYDKHISQEVPV